MIWYLHNDMQNVTSVIWFIDIICIQILRCSGEFARRQKLFKPENTFKQTGVSFFYRKNMMSFLNYMYVTDTLRALFARCGSYHTALQTFNPNERIMLSPRRNNHPDPTKIKVSGTGNSYTPDTNLVPIRIAMNLLRLENLTFCPKTQSPTWWSQHHYYPLHNVQNTDWKPCQS